MGTSAGAGAASLGAANLGAAGLGAAGSGAAGSGANAFFIKHLRLPRRCRTFGKSQCHGSRLFHYRIGSGARPHV